MAQPSCTAFFSAAGACTMIMSTFLSFRSFKDSPEPALNQVILALSCFPKVSARTFKSPNSPGLPVARENWLAPLP